MDARTAAGAHANCSQVVLASNDCHFMLMDRATGSYGQHNEAYNDIHFFRTSYAY